MGNLWNIVLSSTPLLYLTQSLWRDEAFSVLIANPGGWETDRNLVLSVLGNLYTGFEGTPGNLWKIMKLFSLAFLSVVFISLLSNFKKKRENFILFLLWLFVPTAAVIVISFVKPIFVNRYLISSTVAEVFLLVLAISLIKSKIVKRVFLYNPERVKLPNYLGIILIPEEKQRFEFPSFSRVYIVQEDGSYSSYE